MAADWTTTINLESAFKPAVGYLKRPLTLIGSYDRGNLRADLLAAITVAVILLPQAIAFTLIAELPPEMGIYAAIVGAFFGALWGASDQTHTGPANAISLLTLSTLSATAVPGTPEFVLAAGLMAVMVGVFQLAMGLVRLGVLVNFVSHSVIVGFATGAGILIGIKQLKPLLGIAFSSPDISSTLIELVKRLPETNKATAVIGFGSIFLLIILRKINSKLPAGLITMVAASAIVYFFKLQDSGVDVIGQLPSGMPPLAKLPIFDLNLIAKLSSGALAVGAIALVETIAISRSIASETGQRLDSNQEFVGQGIANIAAGFFSGYPVAGSFSRSAVNLSAGAKTPAAAVLSSGFVLLATFFLGPFAAYLPHAALAGVLIVTAWRMINRDEIARIWRGTRGDTIILFVTLFGTIFLEIEFAVLMGILLSFARYIVKTSAPRVRSVLPDHNFRHFTYQPDKTECPQLGIIEVQGDLYFGAVNYVEEFILDHIDKHPEQRHLLLRMHAVNNLDFSGIHMLENVVRIFREQGGDVYMVRVIPPVWKLIVSTGFDKYLGLDHFLLDDAAIPQLFYHALDPAVCIYECPVKVFKECQNLPKQQMIARIPHLNDIPEGSVQETSVEELWFALQIPPTAVPNQTQQAPPYIVDVREPREYRQGHVPTAVSVPLGKVMDDSVPLPRDCQIVLVCRSGRRSRRAAYALQRMGIARISILKGGIAAWEARQLLEAIGDR